MIASPKLSSQRRLLIIQNPTAGGARRRRFDQTLRSLKALGCDLVVRPTQAPGDARKLAAAALAEPESLVVAAGGDGTINEVVNGLMDHGGRQASLPLALLPLGTANVLAAELGLPRKAEDLAQCIAGATLQRIALGHCGDRFFTVMVGVGFDAAVVAGVSLPLKRWLGKAAYVLEAGRQLLRFNYPLYRLTIDGDEFEAYSAIVLRGRYYAGRYLCAPDGDLAAARFQVCLFTRRGLINTLRYGVALPLGWLPRLPDYRIIAAQEVAIAGPQGDPVQGDGDLLAHLPALVTLWPEALEVAVPRRPAPP